MKLISILLLAFILSACDSKQSETQSAQPSTHNHEHDHDHEHDQSAATEAFSLSVGYSEVEPLDSCAKPTVIVFFAYQCPHCYKLEQYGTEWQSQINDKINYLSVPTDLGREEFGVFLAIHHIANNLGVLDKIKPKLFGMIHNNEKPFQNFDDVLAMFSEAGVDLETAKSMFDEQELIVEKVTQSFELMKRYKIVSVPSVLVNYQYQTDVTQAGGYDKVYPLVDDLLKLQAACSNMASAAAAEHADH